MIEQYLSNTNEIATVLILPKILELNKALVLVCFRCLCSGATKCLQSTFISQLLILNG